ncbi:Partner of Y14 and mago, partial [Calypte anna]
YENKYVKFFRSKPELPPGLSPEAAGVPSGKGGEGPEPGLSRTAKRNLKRKEKRKQEKCEREAEGLSAGVGKLRLGEEKKEGNGEKNPPPTPQEGTQNPGEGSEKVRKVKNLRKKLRQVEELGRRVEEGKVQPSPEQREKLERRRALEEELRELE